MTTLQILETMRIADMLAGRGWVPAGCPSINLYDFTTIRIEVSRLLTDVEIDRAHECLEYALRSTLAGEDVTIIEQLRVEDPTSGKAWTIIHFAFDSSTSVRTEPDHAAALALARTMIVEGTPIRTTNRAGEGTEGTRLCEGIGDKAAVRLSVK